MKRFKSLLILTLTVMTLSYSLSALSMDSKYIQLASSSQDNGKDDDSKPETDTSVDVPIF